MKLLFRFGAALGLLLIPVTAIAAGQEPGEEHVTIQFRHELPDSPGKSLTAVVVDYPPGTKSRPHHHAPSAFIYAYVLSGAVRSQVGDEPAKVYGTGESWVEAPGAYHRVSENASSTEPAKLLAVFVANTDEALTRPDPR